jgi:hypothetical protein
MDPRKISKTMEATYIEVNKDVCKHFKKKINRRLSSILTIERSLLFKKRCFKVSEFILHQNAYKRKDFNLLTYLLFIEFVVDKHVTEWMRV